MRGLLDREIVFVENREHFGESLGWTGILGSFILFAPLSSCIHHVYPGLVLQCIEQIVLYSLILITVIVVIWF